MNLTRGEREKLLIALAVTVARTIRSDALHVPAIRSLAWDTDCSRSSHRDENNLMLSS
jgi:urease gamma subunit